MARMYYDADADMSYLAERTVAVLGYGSQGHAQALNLHDAGVDVIVGLYEGSRSWAKAEADGLKVATIADAVAAADVVQVLIPDTIQPRVFAESIAPNLEEGNALAFSHGFNIHYNQIVPPENVDVFMVAPKAPGHRFREHVKNGEGVPGLLAVYQDYTGEAEELALAFARGIGCTRAGVIETTFEEETETDLFGEQAVLCGGVTSLIKAGFETLVDAGYQPEVAYFECLHELKLIVDLIYEGGLGYMRYSVSDTAQYGDLVSGPKVVGEASRQAMADVLEDVQSGAFARQWILENQANRPSFNALNDREEAHLIEEVGAELRSMMAWLQKDRE